MKKWRVSGTKEPSESEPLLGSQTPEKVLGVIWKSEDDSLTLDSTYLAKFAQDAKPSKRTIVSAAARLHDPTGFLSPFVTQIELLLQKTHVLKPDLDQTLPEDLLSK